MAGRSMSIPIKQITWLVLCMMPALLIAQSTAAASFDCTKATTKIEKLICDNDRASRTDEFVELAYSRALERTDDRQKLVQEQREWLETVRNACPDADCLFKALAFREVALKAIPTHKCYWLEPPIKDDSGKRPPVEPICRVMEQNLNQFCDQPPMACGLKIAPQFSQWFTLPTWTPVENVNPALIEEFLRAPWMDTSIKKEKKDALWEEDRPKVEAAFAEKRLTFLQAQLDLYNLGKAQTAYRLDYGNCQANNPQLNDPTQWGMAIHYAEIQIQYKPDIVRPLFKEYFPLQHESHHEVFLFDGKTYSYVMHGTTNPAIAPDDNWMVVNRHEQKTYKGESQPTLLMKNICIFNYQPI
jgi:uncharacterized protein YecT (DUF1311 family)